jgi:hypothetical protein
VSPWGLAAVSVAGLSAGYALGRPRPARRLRDWALATADDANLVGAVPALTIAATFAVHPVRTWRRFHTHQHPEPLAPAPKLDPDRGGGQR